MIGSVVVGVLIFGYAGWALYRYVQKSREGKCASCSSRKSCSSASTGCSTYVRDSGQQS